MIYVKNILPDLECLHIAWTLNMAVIEMNYEKIDYVLSVTKMILRMNFILFLNVQLAVLSRSAIAV